MVSFCLFTLDKIKLMKKYILSLCFAFFSLISLAQDINLSDSVIYFGNKPVAYYVKVLNETDPHYNVYIISLDMKLLLAAQVVKFDAPVRELKPFYYYDLILDQEKDTLAMYHEGQAFPIELANLLKDYKLLIGNAIDERAWRKFKNDYTGNRALKAKIKDYEDYLVEYRHFDEQTVRDRSKPVTIIDDKIIMQDGKKIGLIITGTNTSVGGISTSYSPVLTRDNKVAVQINNTDRGATSSEYTQILLPSKRQVRPEGIIIDTYTRKTKHKGHQSLYDISLPLNKSARNEDILWEICQYVDNYLL